MKRFLIRLLLLLLPVAIAVAGVNYYGDAAHLFSANYENRIADELVKGHNVTNIYNYNERLLQKRLIGNTRNCPGLVVVGSSRVMEISNDFFPGSSFQNNGLSGCSIEDLFAVISLYDQKACYPKKILLGLDPWTLNINNEQERWRSLSREYEAFLEKMPASERPPTKTNFNKWKDAISERMYYAQLLSPSYFQNSIAMVLHRNNQPYVVDTKVNKTFTKLPDGSITYDEAYRSPSPEERQKRTSEESNTRIYSIEGFDSLSGPAQQKLEFLVRYLQQKNTVVSFFLAPYNPVVYRKIQSLQKYRMVKESENYFRTLATKYDIEVIGSFDPSTDSLNEALFYDAMHVNGTGLKKIFTKRTEVAADTATSKK